MLYDELVKLLGKEKAHELSARLNRSVTFIISGPQKSGKTSLVRLLREHGFSAVEDWQCYNFITKDQSEDNVHCDE